ncbi:GUN4 N-terminal ARM-like repeat domain-containing protein [Oscillatoria sp. CS-180]|uniref:GUN4 domain-containing protein n=1 Tax=Oscillatoria sp. CS-180 TaxID=3021720 RepID=UPI00232DC8DA|nr:GUN4 domain-containing protein [Oscillatoria sp. CS-180]MDB9525170.1 GUN4 N-terminal ARM-like repeat domain-containing protein [Oscillatoria sp. CS-180]
MSSSVAHNSQSSLELLESLKRQLSEALPQKQLLLLPQIMEAGVPGYQVLMDFLLEAKTQLVPSVSAGRSLQLLHQVDDPNIQNFLETHFKSGLVSLPNTCGVDYTDLQTALIQQDFELADRLTLQKMCELAGTNAIQRKWLYFTEVKTFPNVDLQTLDQLWLIYSEGKFGFSKQREIWLGVGQDWEKLWPKIAWKDGNVWTRYPGGFIWDLQAPAGHLPLTNQLRGVRVMDALMNHPAWQTS